MARSATILAATILMALFSPVYAQTATSPEGPGHEKSKRQNLRLCRRGLFAGRQSLPDKPRWNYMRHGWTLGAGLITSLRSSELPRPCT